MNGGKGWLGNSNTAVCLERRVQQIEFHWNSKLESLIKHIAYYEKGVCFKKSEYNLNN